MSLSESADMSPLLPIHSPDGVKIDLHIKFGRLTASVILNNPKCDFEAYDMIKENR